MSDPFTSLLDLDRGRLPGLMLRLDGKDYPLRSPEALPWPTPSGWATVSLLRLAETRRFDAVRFDAAVQEIAARSSRRVCPSRWARGRPA